MRAHLSALAAIDEELALLALLARARVKPVARYEKRLPDEARRHLSALGLRAHAGRRLTDAGVVVEENVFARDAAALARYREAFDGTPLRVSPWKARVEGELLGFPACCVEAYVGRPYVDNGLPAADQALLFHWACPSCAVTPHLVPIYRRADAAIRRLVESHDGLAAGPLPRRGGVARLIAGPFAAW